MEIYFLFTQGVLDTRKGLEIYIFFEWVGYQGRFGDIFKYLLRVGWILGKIWRFINSMWVGFNGKFEYQFNLREPLLKQP